MHKVTRLIFLHALMLVPLSGCGGPEAAMDLIAVGRKGIAHQKQALTATHSQLVRQLKATQAALDSAFDADVRLAAGRQIKDAEGSPIALSPEWIISARKGYIAARDAIAEQILSAESVHLIQQDNLHAADEALEMAANLVIQQALISDRIKQYLMKIQRRLISDTGAD